MSLKILGGIAKGCPLFVPRGQAIRPTSILLKRRLFDSIQDFSGFEFYDLCAGTGAIGLEAWSRGASSCFFLEKSRRVYHLLRKNIERLTTLHPEEARRRKIFAQTGSMEKWRACAGEIFASKKSILFIDPPYEIHSLYKKDTLKIMTSQGILCEVWIESDGLKGVPLSFWEEQGLRPYKVFEQGGRYIALFRDFQKIGE